jgi:hypothetical protein
MSILDEIDVRYKVRLHCRGHTFKQFARMNSFVENCSLMFVAHASFVFTSKKFLVFFL